MSSVCEKEKIVDFDHFNESLYASEIARPIVVQCHGVFDLLHIGHIKHFQAAKAKGDILVVTITPDQYVNKGHNRPRFTERLRAEAIAALDCVDYVIINRWPTAVEAIQLIRPNIYVKGDEYQHSENDITGKIDEEVRAVTEVGGKIFFTSEQTFSSSALINDYFSSFPKEILSYLADFKKKFNFQAINNYFENAKRLKILLIGEAIIDDYRFTEVIGKAGKEPTLVAKFRRRELYAGGVLAMANHLSDFCAEVTCLTYLGENKEYENFIQNSIKENVKIVPIYKRNSPTIVKRRYLDEYLKQKLFEEYEINDDFIEGCQHSELLEKINLTSKQSDLSIVVDYGHGLLDEKSIECVISRAKFLAVNTQANAGNHGFNCISKYKKANYVSLASRELQLNYRQKHLSISEQMKRLISEYDYGGVMITGGKDGVHICRVGESSVTVPAFATSVIDRVGAGDAVLALSSLFAYQNAPSELIGFIGNLAGSEAVNIMGNKSAINRVGFIKHIAHLLK